MTLQRQVKHLQLNTQPSSLDIGFAGLLAMDHTFFQVDARPISRSRLQVKLISHWFPEW